MPIIARCPNPACGQEIGIPDDSVGKRLMCPFCETEFVAGKKKAADDQQKQAQQQKPAQKQKPSQAPPKQPASPPQKSSTSGGKQSPGRLREHTSFRASDHQKSKAPQRPAETRYVRQQAAPWIQALHIVALVVAIGVTVAGAIVLIKPFSSATIAGSPEELYNNLVWAVQNDDYEKLEDLLAEGQLDIAQTYGMKIQEAVEKTVGHQAVTEGDPLTNIIALLKSPMFNINTWEFNTSYASKSSGQIVYDDTSGRNQAIGMEHEDVGWRLNLVTFVLKRIQESEKIEEIKQAEGKAQATDAQPEKTGGAPQPKDAEEQDAPADTAP